MQERGSEVGSKRTHAPQHPETLDHAGLRAEDRKSVV